MRLLLALLVTSVVCSCAATAPPKKEPQQAPPNLHKDYQAAEANARSGDYKKAVARLKRILEKGPESDIADDAHYLLAQIYSSQQQSNEALTNYQAILEGGTASPLEEEAGVGSARTLLRLGRAKEAEDVLSRSGNWKDVSPEQSIEIDRLRYEAQAAQKKNLEALATLVSLTDRVPQTGDKEKFKALAVETMESRLNEEELNEVATSSRFGFLQAPAKFRYGLMLADQKQYAKARRYFSEVASLAPGSEIAERAQSLMVQIDARHKVDARTVGVILPLTGKQSAIGYKALRGIQLGLGIYGSNQSNFRLAVMDSEGNPDSARRAVERLVLEDNVIGIIGGVLSKTASAEAAKAQEFGVPTILLSQKSGVTQAGDAIFRNALTSQMQVQYLVDMAMNKLGYKSFAMVYPNDAYGVEFANLFWDEVKARGGLVTGAQPYDPKETDFRGHIQRLVGTYYLEDRADEYRAKTKQWAEKNPKRSARANPPAIEDLLPPVVDFDALFIPDSARAVGQIAPMLAYNNVTKVRLLGTNLWNSSNLVNRGQKFVENAVFVDSFLSADPTFQNSLFVSSFKTAFGEEPGLTEVQAYDSAFILRQLLGSGENTRPGLQQRLATLQNFPGAIGALSVNENREIRRPLTSLTVKEGKITALESTQK